MRTNEATSIVGDLVVLVPYKRFHVPKYHSWMVISRPSCLLVLGSLLSPISDVSPLVLMQLDPELREATASEPLTMEVRYFAFQIDRSQVALQLALQMMTCVLGHCRRSMICNGAGGKMMIVGLRSFSFRQWFYTFPLNCTYVSMFVNCDAWHELVAILP